MDKAKGEHGVIISQGRRCEGQGACLIACVCGLRQDRTKGGGG